MQYKSATTHQSRPEFGIVEASNLCKSFGAARALCDVSFRIDPGEFVAVLGANGAGKTTLIRLLAGLARPSSGEIFIKGLSVRRHPSETRRAVGVMSHHIYLYDDLTAEENLRFYARMFEAPQARAETLLKEVGLWEHRRKRIRTFSRGMAQRVSLARALLHDPEILLLDEPFTGLDVYAREKFKSMLDKFLDEKRTVILTLHDIDYALEKAQRVLILRHGRLVCDRPVDRLFRTEIMETLLPSEPSLK
ncbi:MAG: heme ABC exporter ATP-binding protein CcmA [candidate division KSB1 bacterium]|nr:heme ABC exporter ATP-binding protein CcmA [candidate division KSB1 bacterium]